MSGCGLVSRAVWPPDFAGGRTHSRARSSSQYDTSVSRKVTRNGHSTLQTARPNVSSSALSPSGALVCATLSGHLPTLYELSSARPLATFSSPAPPPPPTSSPNSPAAPPRSFPRGYRNTTTTKHGSFGGGRGAEPGRGLYYAAGSDDFAAYVWEVPSLEAMREGRKEVRSEEIEEGRVGAFALCRLCRIYRGYEHRLCDMTSPAQRSSTPPRQPPAVPRPSSRPHPAAPTATA